MSKAEKIKLALSNLQILHPKWILPRNMHSEKFINEAFDWSLNAVLYYPGQLMSFSAIIKPQGNIYFASAHLSSTLT